MLERSYRNESIYAQEKVNSNRPMFKIRGIRLEKPLISSWIRWTGLLGPRSWVFYGVFGTMYSGGGEGSHKRMDWILRKTQRPDVLRKPKYTSLRLVRSNCGSVNVLFLLVYSGIGHPGGSGSKTGGLGFEDNPDTRVLGQNSLLWLVPSNRASLNLLSDWFTLKLMCSLFGLFKLHTAPIGSLF